MSSIATPAALLASLRLGNATANPTVRTVPMNLLVPITLAANRKCRAARRIIDAFTRRGSAMGTETAPMVEMKRIARLLLTLAYPNCRRSLRVG